MNRFFGSTLVLLSLIGGASLSTHAQAQAQERTAEQSDVITVETFPVLDLPLNIRDVTLTKSNKGYLLKGTLTNDSDGKILGFRYLLVQVDSNNVVRPAILRSEGCKLGPYASEKMTFSTPLKLKLKNAARLELMLDQVIGELSIWEVLKARQALEAYASGDYSVIPKVLRVSNHVDAPLRQIIYR